MSQPLRCSRPVSDLRSTNIGLPGASAVCVDILLGEAVQVRIPLSVSPTWLAALVCALRG